MTEADQIVRHLLEEGEMLTIAQLIDLGNQPEQWVLDMFGSHELEIPLTVRAVDPATLLIHDKPLPSAANAARKGPTWKIVQAYMRKPGDPILLNDKEVLDGHHRAMAAYLSKRPVRAINANDLPVEESEEDLDDLDVGLPFSLESYLQKHGFQIAVPPDLGFEKLFDRGSSRLRIGHIDSEEGVRKVEYYGGNIPLWTKYLTDEEIVEMIDRNSRIGESEEEFADEDWQDVTPVIEPILMRAGFSRPSDYPDKWVRVKEHQKPFKWVREVIWNDGQQWNYQAQTKEQTGRWNTYAKEKFDTEGDLLWLLKTYRIADVGSAMQENEEDEFGEDDWKDVSPPVNASEIQRWCFTDYELHEPKRCTGKDVFYANGDAELAVIVMRDGTVTNMWEDGTVGVPDSVKQMADFDESPVKPSHRRTIDTDHYADNWCDVYVGKNGEFLAFVVRESEDEDFEDIREIIQTNPVEEINTRFDRGRWIELATAGPTSYIRRRYDGEEVVRWQIISWSNEDKAWRLVDTGKGVVEGEMEDVLNSADRLWAQP